MKFEKTNYSNIIRYKERKKENKLRLCDIASPLDSKLNICKNCEYLGYTFLLCNRMGIIRNYVR